MLRKISFLLMLCTLNFLGTARAQHNKKLKIAYVIDAYQEQKSGGVVSANRFMNLFKKKHDLVIVSTEKLHGEGYEKVPGFYFPFAKEKMKKNGMKFGLPNTKKLESIFKDVDLIYIHFPFYLGLKAIKVAKKMGKAVVVGFHLQPENLLMNVGVKSKSAAAMMYRMFINKFYNLADMTICPSYFAEELLLANKHFNGNTVVISNGLTPEFRPRPSEPFPEYKDKFVILTVGRLAKEKRHDVIIDAIKKSKYKDNIKLVVTGNGVLKDQLIEMGKSMSIEPDIGFVEEDRLIRLYNTANLYIHASDVELEGMSVLEAIGSGCPALISDAVTSASKQFAIEDRFLFSSGNGAQLAEKIDYWYENREELKEAGAAFARSAEKYYIESSADRMSEIFMRTIAFKKHQKTG
ncbi:MAG: glycosyltransferase [Oligoflexales bacterium]